MNGLDAVLVAIFAAVWLVPLALAVRWERRLLAERRSSAAAEASIGTPDSAVLAGDRSVEAASR